MFNFTQVSSVYSGRKGCACGCRGKYSYASHALECRPSYLKGDDGVSDRSVKVIMNRVEKFLRDPNSHVESVMVDKGGEWIAVDMEHDQTYTVYFKTPSAEPALTVLPVVDDAGKPLPRKSLIAWIRQVAGL